MAFYHAVWRGYRPYLVRLLIDFLVASTIYLLLYLFELIECHFPIPGWAARVIDATHATGSVAALVIFTWFAIIDVVKIHKEK